MYFWNYPLFISASQVSRITHFMTLCKKTETTLTNKGHYIDKGELTSNKLVQVDE